MLALPESFFSLFVTGYILDDTEYFSRLRVIFSHRLDVGDTPVDRTFNLKLDVIR